MRGIIVCLALLGASSAAACRKSPPDLVTHYQCARCHSAIGKLEAASTQRGCVSCHQAIFIEGGAFAFKYKAEKLELWRSRVVHLRHVPTLTGIDRHIRQEWLVSFLQNPIDLRPALEETMPRFQMSEAHAKEIAAYFIPIATQHEAAALGELEAGRKAMAEKSCTTCHAFTGVRRIEAEGRPPDVPQAQLGIAIKLAPDLRHTRARMSPSSVRAWLSDPQAIKPDALMPRIPLTEDELNDVTAYILGAELEPLAPLEAPVRLPVLTRAVNYAEVEARVFHRICWHCHSDPEPVGGDGGPGNTGGLGFRGKRIDLSTRKAILRGGSHDDGTRIDLLARDAEGVPKLVRQMMVRHAEVSGRAIDGVRGMPLGLPPMSLPEIQLVESWIAQGCPE